MSSIGSHLDIVPLGVDSLLIPVMGLAVVPFVIHLIILSIDSSVHSSNFAEGKTADGGVDFIDLLFLEVFHVSILSFDNGSGVYFGEVDSDDIIIATLSEGLTWAFSIFSSFLEAFLVASHYGNFFADSFVEVINKFLLSDVIGLMSFSDVGLKLIVQFGISLVESSN